MEPEGERVNDDSQANVIDLIDLTKESPEPSALNFRQRYKNVPVNHNGNARSNLRYVARGIVSPIIIQREHNWYTDPEDILAIENFIRDSRTRRAEETIELDDSTSEEDNKHYTVESENGEETLTCPVCLESLSSKRKPTTTKCGHIFCATCLKTSIRRSKQCPTCKSTVTLKSCIRLYF